MSIEQKVQQTGSVVKPWVLLKLFIWLCVCKRERETEPERESIEHIKHTARRSKNRSAAGRNVFNQVRTKALCNFLPRARRTQLPLKESCFLFFGFGKNNCVLLNYKDIFPNIYFFLFFFIIVFSLLFSIHFKNVFRTCWWCQTASRVPPEEWMFYRFLNEENASLQCRVYDCNGTQLNLVYSSRV